MPKPSVLVVDDDPAIRKFVRANLESRDYHVLMAVDGAEALQRLESELVDLIVLDIMMPRVDGFEVCRRVREWSPVPIMMLSARGDEMDKVRCLESGADDYLTKPFGVEELLARVRAIIRRTIGAHAVPARSSFNCDGIQINFAERRVTVSGREVRLTPTEYNLLQELVLNADKVITHNMLLAKVWGPEYSEEKEYLRVYIGHLRKYLETTPENPRYIVTIPGVGYQFKTSRANQVDSLSRSQVTA
ncbi:MAG: response regulator transcription factor [Chloroflexi bacterium]|nr:response regulator transcription factor [Chloroflexota bacterium]